MLKNCLWIILAALYFGCSNETNIANDQADTASPVSQVNDSLASAPKNDAVASSGFTIDYLMGKFQPSGHEDFVKIDAAYASDSDMYLRKDAYNAFLKMHTAAKKDGIDLKIISATRPFDHQKRIWEAKWTGTRKVGGRDLSMAIPNPEARALKILEYSSMPGTSRHHWGTDIDLNSLEPSFFKSGEGEKIFEWLRKNAGTFGFCQPYSPKGTDRPYGYNEEHWHWSYMPTAKQLTTFARQNLTNEKVSGFKGAEVAEEIDVVGRYVLGINPECLP